MKCYRSWYDTPAHTATVCSWLEELVRREEEKRIMHKYNRNAARKEIAVKMNQQFRLADPPGVVFGIRDHRFSRYSFACVHVYNTTT